MSAKSRQVAIAAGMLLALTGAAPGQTTWYVDDDNCPIPGMGTPGDPFCSIQRAIDESAGGDEVIVAPGTYHETINFNGKGIRLRSSDGPDVTTIDATGLNDTVVRCVSGEAPDTVLEGLTITGGRAFPHGGGMIIQDASPTVRDCVFRDNMIRDGPGAICGGGGMYVAGGSPTVTNCQFISNSLLNQSGCFPTGGGMYNYSSSPTVTGCTFFANLASSGGGMLNLGGNPTVTDCVFVENGMGFGGGGMYNAGFGGNYSLTVTNCIFKDNAGFFGGGMFNASGINLTVSNCTFSANTASEGGAMYNVRGSPLVTNCVFVENVATSRRLNDGGGAIYNGASRPTLTNCRFSGNTAGAMGGAIFNFNASNPVIINCSFSGNAAGVSGGVMYSTNSSPSMANCILWGNGLDQVVDGVNAASTITFSVVQGGFTGTGNIDADPLFVDPDGRDNIFGTEDDNLRLLPGSPAIDAGDNTAVPPDTADLDGDNDTTEPTPVDLDGSPRFVANPGTPPIVDMGPYESPNCNALVEDCNNNGNSDLCDLLEGTSADCNNNNVPDECDIAAGTSRDVFPTTRGGDGVPDECQTREFTPVGH